MTGLARMPHCERSDVRKRRETLIGRIGRWNCRECKTTFKGTHGTVYQGTKNPLQKWFLAFEIKYMISENAPEVNKTYEKKTMQQSIFYKSAIEETISEALGNQSEKV